MKKIRSLIHILVFLCAFIVPQIILFIFSISYLENNNNSQYTLNLETEHERMYFQYLSESMTSKIDIHTFQILANNIIVGIILWGAVAAIYFLLFGREKNKTDKIAKITFRIAYLSCFFFFLKEGFRVGLTVLDFYQSMNIPYLVTTLTLILPHAIFEFMAFIMIAIFSLFWLKENLETSTGKTSKPKVLSIILPVVLISASAVIETTITPMIFSQYIHSIL